MEPQFEPEEDLEPRKEEVKATPPPIPDRDSQVQEEMSEEHLLQQDNFSNESHIK